MNCKCLETVNAKLAERGLRVKTHVTIDAGTGQLGEALGIELIPTRKGVKPSKAFSAYCPFCGKPNK